MCKSSILINVLSSDTSRAGGDDERYEGAVTLEELIAPEPDDTSTQ